MSEINLHQKLLDLDKDHDGIVSPEEVKTICQTLDLDITMVPAIIHAYDDNGDGKITIEEFESYWNDRNSNKETIFKHLFEHIDKNKSGFVDVSEMMEFTLLIGEPATRSEAQEQLEDIDTNEDGKVSYSELWEVFKDYI